MRNIPFLLLLVALGGCNSTGGMAGGDCSTVMGKNGEAIRVCENGTRVTVEDVSGSIGPNARLALANLALPKASRRRNPQDVCTDSSRSAFNLYSVTPAQKQLMALSQGLN